MLKKSDSGQEYIDESEDPVLESILAELKKINKDKKTVEPPVSNKE